MIFENIFLEKVFQYCAKCQLQGKAQVINVLETLKLFRQVRRYCDFLHLGIQLHTTHTHMISSCIVKSRVGGFAYSLDDVVASTLLVTVKQ